MDLERRPEI